MSFSPLFFCLKLPEFSYSCCCASSFSVRLLKKLFGGDELFLKAGGALTAI